MHQQELVSVVMSIYKEPVDFLKKSIDSILNQSYSNLEFIIINDNPDGAYLDEFISSYKDNRIVYLKNSKNLGLAKSLNKAIKICNGYFIARMDADDISYSSRIEKQVIFLENNLKIDVVGSFATLIDEKGLEKGAFKVKTTIGLTKIASLLGVPFIHPTVMFRDKVFSEHNFYYNPEFTTAQDFELWSRLLHKLNGSNLPFPLLYYRESEQQLSKNKIIDQTTFFVRALDSNLNKLGVNCSDNDLELLQKMSRNNQQKLFISDIIKLRIILIRIYKTIPNYSYYNKQLLLRHLFISFSLTFSNFQGSKFLFYKEIFKFARYLNVKTGLYLVKMIFQKIRLVIFKK